MLGVLYVYGLGTEKLTPESIRDRMLALEHWGPILYIVSNAFRPFLLFPAIVLGVAGGLAFGPFWGTVYLVIGTVFGAVLCFGAARMLELDRLKRLLPKWLRLEELDAQAVGHGFRTMLLFRLAPILPWDAVSFMAGMSKVRFWPYLLATFVGSIPGAIAFCYLGDALFQPLASWPWVVLVGIALTSFYLFLRK